MLAVVDASDKPECRSENATLRSALQAAVQSTVITPAIEVQVLRILDRYHALQDGSGSRPLSENAACLFRKMYACQRQGRVNAYASMLIRLRRLAQSI
jgi:hypothetical protein